MLSFMSSDAAPLFLFLPLPPSSSWHLSIVGLHSALLGPINSKRLASANATRAVPPRLELAQESITPTPTRQQQRRRRLSCDSAVRRLRLTATSGTNDDGDVDRTP
eukprot:3855402-Rhodomonas_salina.1